MPNFKNLSEIDLSDTLVTDRAVKTLTTDSGHKVPLHVVRDGAIDRLRNAGVAIPTRMTRHSAETGLSRRFPVRTSFKGQSSC